LDAVKIPRLQTSALRLLLVTPAISLLAGGGAFAELTAWPEFHNGVAAGLRLAPGTHQLTRTWVVYNKPPGEGCHQHAVQLRPGWGWG
jgi:anaphase-promoting complex subunit 1